MVNSRRYLKFLICLLLGWGALGPTVTAQSNEAVQVKFVVFANGLPKNINYLPEPDEEVVTLQFFSSDRSRQYEYKGPNPLVFFQEVEVPPDPQRPNAPRIQRVPVGYVSIPTGIREAFILFSPDGVWGPNTIPRYSVSLFDDSVRALPAGHVAILNAAGKQLFGRVANAEVGIPSGMSPPIPVGSEEFSIDVFSFETGERESLYFDQILLGSQQRLTILLMPFDRDGKFRLQRSLLYDPPGKPARQSTPSNENAQ